MIHLLCVLGVILLQAGTLNSTDTFGKWTINQIRSTGTPWPLPQLWRSSRIQFQVKTDQLRITSNAVQCDVLQEAIRRYQKIFSLSAVHLHTPVHEPSDNGINVGDHIGESDADHAPSGDHTGTGELTPVLKELLITVDRPDLCLYPQAGDNESYRLEVGRPTNHTSTGSRSETIRLQASARIRSASIWGALRALETFAQLIHVNVKRHRLVVNATRIADWPAFSHRGVMVDSSSHFIPMRTLLAMLDAMEANKLNVLHWCVGGGSVSWPLYTRTAPRLSKFGSFSAKHVYQQADVFTLVETARMRGIRVIPEVGITANALAIRRSFPHLVVCCSSHVSTSGERTNNNNNDEPEMGEHTPIDTSGEDSDIEHESNEDNVNDRGSSLMDSIEGVVNHGNHGNHNHDHDHNHKERVFKDARRKKRSYEPTASTLYVAESGGEHTWPNHSTAGNRTARSSENTIGTMMGSIGTNGESTAYVKLTGGEADGPQAELKECTLDPTRNGTYRLIHRILGEWRSQFVDEHVHMGLQAVRSDCWQQKSSVRRVMHAAGLRSSLDLSRQFVVRLIDHARSIGFRSIVWQEAFEQALDFNMNSNVTVQLWKGDERWDNGEEPEAEVWQQMARVLAKNRFSMILSTCWKLNSRSSQTESNQDWLNMYQCDPFSFTDNASERELMKGGEAIVRGETVDATNLLAITWPRASAMAERLWTNPGGPIDRLLIFDRLQEQRCRLLLRGIPAEPMAAGFCGPFEWDMQ